jgi:hypothetical protein
MWKHFTNMFVALSFLLCYSCSSSSIDVNSLSTEEVIQMVLGLKEPPSELR